MLLNHFLLRFMPIPLMMFLIGCVPATVDTPPPTEQSCQASHYETLLWKPQSALDSVELPKGTRVIPHRQPVTMDFRTDRMNITIGKQGRIERVYCG